MDFNVDGQLPHQENPNLTQTNDSAGTPNGNYDEVIGGFWHGDFRKGQQNAQSQRPRLRYYSGNNPSVAAPAGTPLSINVRMRLLAPATAQLASMNADRDFYIDFRNGSGLMLMEFLYSGDTAENKIGGIQASGSLGLIDTGSTFADFHTYTYVWDSLFDGTGTGEVGVVDVYMDGAFIGVTKAYNGGANTNGYTLFGDGATADGTEWQVDWIRFGTDQVVVAPKWKLNGSSVWSDVANWTDGSANSSSTTVPNAIGAVANFTDAISSAQTITVDAPQTVGRIHFDNANSYTIDGAGSLTIDYTGAALNGVIDVLQGSHSISSPIHFKRNTAIAVTSASSVLTLSGELSFESGVALSKQGPGTLEINRVRTDGLSINGGLVKIASNGGASGTSNVKNLTIAGDTDAWTGGLDLRNNGAVIDYPDTSPLETVANQLKSGFSGGNWGGATGITSSAAATASATNDKTAIGYAEAAALGWTELNGQSFDGNALVLVYTYTGDANLDRKVTTQDFNQLAGSFGEETGKHWTDGDFNYSGGVDSVDFGMLVANYGKTLAESAPSLGSAVPEPSGLLSAVIVAAALAARRHRSAAGE
jgi:hypothetical protein